jgi:thymidylate kinase
MNPRGGLLIALVGADGSGKSSLAKRVVTWLRWKLDARVIYFGSGDGPSSFLRLPFRQVLRLVIAARSDTRRPVAPLRDRVPTPVRALWALVLALEKRRRLMQVWRARNRGLVVVCDRYPQNQIMGFADGPLLDRWQYARSPWLRMLARWEATPYAWAQAHAPDLVLKLRVTPGVAVRRKPEMRPRRSLPARARGRRAAFSHRHAGQGRERGSRLGRRPARVQARGLGGALA